MVGIMDAQTKSQIGTRSGDQFRHWHKTQLPARFWSCDVDLVFIEKSPSPAPVAVIDYKLRDGETDYPDKPRFTEIIKYNWYIKNGVPVFIVKSDVDLRSFDIYEYLEGNWKPDPPTGRMRIVMENASAKDFESWEWRIRGYGVRRSTNTPASSS